MTKNVKMRIGAIATGVSLSPLSRDTQMSAHLPDREGRGGRVEGYEGVYRLYVLTPDREREVKRRGRSRRSPFSAEGVGLEGEELTHTIHSSPSHSLALYSTMSMCSGLPRCGSTQGWGREGRDSGGVNGAHLNIATAWGVWGV